MKAPSTHGPISRSQSEHAEPRTGKARGNPADWMQRLIGRHCAGLASCPTGAMLFSYLRNDPPASSIRGPLEWAAYAVLGKSTPAELIDLMSFGQIPPSRIAAHLRALGANNQPAIRFLNQFATNSGRATTSGAAIEPES